MAIFETFSKRKKRLESSGKQDVYQYDELPYPLRVQVTHILKSVVGPTNYNVGSYTYQSPKAANGFWVKIHDKLCRELGVFVLSGGDYADSRCQNYLLGADTLGALDMIELTFKGIDGIVRAQNWCHSVSGVTQTPDDAIAELNARFREHGVGYQFSNGMLVRIDSELIHAEVVKPALSLLSEPGFEGAQQEFLNAHDHYRHGKAKEAMGEALKALESTMKAICSARGWTLPSRATASALIGIMKEKGIFPPELESHLSGLRSAMESGLPTVSNPNRHGQGATPVDVAPHVVAYALHLCASNIVFLVEAHKAKK